MYDVDDDPTGTPHEKSPRKEKSKKYRKSRNDSIDMELQAMGARRAITLDQRSRTPSLSPRPRKESVKLARKRMMTKRAGV